MKRFYTLLLLVLFGGALTAQQQNMNGYLEAGRNAEAIGDYVQALKDYRIALEFAENTGQDAMLDDIRYTTGLAAFNGKAYRSAMTYMAGVANSGGLPPATPLPVITRRKSTFRRGEYDAARPRHFTSNLLPRSQHRMPAFCNAPAARSGGPTKPWSDCPARTASSSPACPPVSIR